MNQQLASGFEQLILMQITMSISWENIFKTVQHFLNTNNCATREEAVCPYISYSDMLSPSHINSKHYVPILLTYVGKHCPILLPTQVCQSSLLTEYVYPPMLYEHTKLVQLLPCRVWPTALPHQPTSGATCLAQEHL